MSELPTVSLETRTTSAGRRPYYLVIYRRTGSRRQRRTIATCTTHRRIAEQMQRDLQLRIAGGYDPFGAPTDALTLARARDLFLEDCRSRGLRPATVDGYGAFAGQFILGVGGGDRDRGDYERGADVLLESLT